MSEPLTGPAGFYGKIPARGDFVRFGLPRGFIEAWDGWLREVLAASQTTLGGDWLPAWLEAPVWRFALAPGLAGSEGALGLWMPSVDQAGRYFPLTLAAICPRALALRDAGGFLDAVERAGREAIAADLSPQALAERVVAALSAPAAEAGVAGEIFPSAGALWWSAGAPRRPAYTFATAGLPSAGAFLAMLDARLEAPA
jgi:type VI secretion system protein ImpM